MEEAEQTEEDVWRMDVGERESDCQSDGGGGWDIRICGHLRDTDFYHEAVIEQLSVVLSVR